MQTGKRRPMPSYAFIDRELPRIAEIAPVGYFLALRINGSSPMMAFHTYPQAWIDEYTESGYVLRDPITTWSLTVGGAVRWSSALLPDPFGIFRKAARHGIHYGASVAVGKVGALTICSIGHDQREFTDDEIAAVRAIVTDLHERVGATAARGAA